MRPVAPGRPQVMRGERESLVGEELFGPVVGDRGPLELEEQQRRRDRGAAFFDLLHQRATRRIGGVDAEVEPRVVVGPADDVLQLREPGHERRELAGIERGDASTRGRELLRDRVGATEQRVDARFAGFRKQRLQIPDDAFGRQVSGRHVHRSQAVRGAAARRVRELRRPHGVARYRLKPGSRRGPSTSGSAVSSAFGTHRASAASSPAIEFRADPTRRRPEVEDHVVVRLGIRSRCARPSPRARPPSTSSPVSSRTSRATASCKRSPNSTRPPGGAHAPTRRSPPPLHEQQATGVLDDRADGDLDPRFRVHGSRARRAAACASRAHAR